MKGTASKALGQVLIYPYLGGDMRSGSYITHQNAPLLTTKDMQFYLKCWMQNKINLMNELEKVRKVANPHLTLFVGDALAGNDAVDQAKAFQQILKFDGAILTKMDTDAKGGAGLSIAFATGRPIVMVGVGQEYDDLQQFEPNWLLDEMFV